MYSQLLQEHKKKYKTTPGVVSVEQMLADCSKARLTILREMQLLILNKEQLELSDRLKELVATDVELQELMKEINTRKVKFQQI